jgi:hypothetical protein
MPPPSDIVPEEDAEGILAGLKQKVEQKESVDKPQP